MAGSAGIARSEAASTIVPTVENEMSVHGGSFEDNAALAAAMVARSGGNQKKGLGAFQGLADALGDKDKFRPTANIEGGLSERLEALASNPELARKFERSAAAEHLSPEARGVFKDYMHGPLRDAAARAQLPSEDQARRSTGELIGRIHSTPEQIVTDSGAPTRDSRR